MARVVQFFFGIGSRYSYLAATQVPRLAAETGVHFEWQPLDSRRLIAQTGPDPFHPESLRGQYDPAYRTRDAARWAAYYGVPYKEPEWSRIDWPSLAHACVAASGLGSAETFSLRLFDECFGKGATEVSKGTLEKLATDVGINTDSFVRALVSPETKARHEQNVEAAKAAGAFGVPSFVLDDGQLFWGQDRLPLLRHVLIQK